MSITRNEHVPNEDVVWSKARSALIDKESKESIRGLLPTLNRNFYPSYQFKDARFGPSGPTTSLAKPTKGKSSRVKGGLFQGRKFDTGVDRSIKLLRAYQFRPEVFWTPSLYKIVSKRKDITAEHKIWLKRIFSNSISKSATVVSYVKMFWQLMRDMQLRPQSTQVTVSHPDLPVGTRIDLVCIGMDHRYHIVEMKTGFENYYHKHTSVKMKYPFDDQPDSAYSQHQLQLSFGNDMYKKQYPTHKVGDPFVLRVHPGGVHVVPQAKWAEERMSAAWGVIRKENLLPIPASVSTKKKKKVVKSKRAVSTKKKSTTVKSKK
jgi:hypothetical protein